MIFVCGYPSDLYPQLALSCRSVGLAAFMHGSLDSLHVLNMPRSLCHCVTEHDFPPTVFPTLWVYNNMQGKEHLLQKNLPDFLPSCSGLHAHLLFFYISSANLSESISPAISSSAYCALPSLNSRSLGGHNCASFLAVPCSLWDHSSLTRDRTCAPCIGSGAF